LTSPIPKSCTKKFQVNQDFHAQVKETRQWKTTQLLEGPI